MGNDGGSIPGRRELVKEKKRERRVNRQAMDRARALYCAISKERFKKPLVICRLGNIYNKSTIVTALVEKKIPKCFSYIRSLKDVKEANVTLKSQVTGNPMDTSELVIVCPITQSEDDGVHRFCMIWNCGCVISEMALKELHGGKSGRCINCNKPYSQSELISLNMTKEEQDKLRPLLIKSKEKSFGKKKLEEQKDKSILLTGIRKAPEESKEKVTETLDVVKKLKEEILAEAKPDLLKPFMYTGGPWVPDKDDFMTRCAHR